MVAEEADEEGVTTAVADFATSDGGATVAGLIAAVAGGFAVDVTEEGAAEVDGGTAWTAGGVPFGDGVIVDGCVVCGNGAGGVTAMGAAAVEGAAVRGSVVDGGGANAAETGEAVDGVTEGVILPFAVVSACACNCANV